MQAATTASQLLLFSIKHTVSGLARDRGAGREGVCVCVCVRLHRRKNVALWRAVKGAVNLREERQAAGQSTQTHTSRPTQTVPETDSTRDTRGTHHEGWEIFR